MLFDTHTHLDQEEFDADRDDVVDRARAAGVQQLIAVGTTLETSRRCVELASQYEGVYAAVGIQPNYVAEAGDDDWRHIVELVDQPAVVAVGETGLDKYWDHAPLDLQQDYFQRHMKLAREKNLPFIVHMRDCDDEILAALQAAAQPGPLQGVMHSFTGDERLAAECLELGLMISFAGMVTFKKSVALRRCAATVPDDRLLVETDSPYLSPEPVRGRRPNEPAHVRHTAACLAEVRQTTLDSLARLTTANAERFFNIKRAPSGK